MASVGDLRVPYNITWNKTNIEHAMTCTMQFYLLDIEKIKTPTIGPFVMGIFVHHILDKLFFNEKKEPKYKSPESFANAVAGKRNERGRLKGGMWIHSIKDNKYRGKLIEWQSREEPFILRERLWKLCHISYPTIVKYGPPLHSELSFNFEIDGKHFNGRIDQLRKINNRPHIWDFKTGLSIPGDMMRSYDPQFTLYSLAIGVNCYKNREFARSIGITDEEAEKFPEDPGIIARNMALEYFLLEYNEIIRVKRDNIQYNLFLDMVDSKERQINSGNISVEIGRHCDRCLARRECDKRTGGRIAEVYHSFQPDLFSYIPKILEQPKEKPKIKQITLRFPKSKIN